VMSWRSFLVWNALGGITWSTTVALAAYYGGKGVEHVLAQIGTYGLIAAALLVVAGALVLWRRHAARQA